MKLRFILCIPLVLLVGCSRPEPPAPPEKTLADRMSEYAVYNTSSGRFALTETQTGLRLFDTLTADLWVWPTGSTNWTKLPNPFRQEHQ